MTLFESFLFKLHVKFESFVLNKVTLKLMQFNLMQLVLSTGCGVDGFTLDPSLGEFILTHPNIKVNTAFFIS